MASWYIYSSSIASGISLLPGHDLYLTVYYLHTNTHTASTAAARCPLSTSENNQGRL